MIIEVIKLHLIPFKCVNKPDLFFLRNTKSYGLLLRFKFEFDIRNN